MNKIKFSLHDLIEKIINMLNKFSDFEINNYKNKYYLI